MSAAGKANITPYWRTIKSKGELNEKYPGGLEAHSNHLTAEGHIVEKDRNGLPKKVKDFEKALVEV
jgi:hypothetical protein